MTSSTTFLDPAAAPHRPWLRSVQLVLVTVLALLALWLAIDAASVLYPASKDAIYAASVPLLVVSMVGGFWIHCNVHRGPLSPAKAVGTLVVSCGGALLLVYYVGIPFHLWLGGSL